MKVSIVILNYNGEKHLNTFLPSVVKYCPEWAEIVVADNGSSDGSEVVVTTKFPSVKWLALDDNYGFAGGYNRALANNDAAYYAILNSDVEVTENWLGHIVEILDKHPDVVAAQPKILDYRQRDRFEYAGAAGGFMDRYGYPFCRGRIFSHCEKDHGQYDEAREVFWATGACLVIRSKAFKEAGGFDEDLFAHMEEIDLCWRLKNLGHRIFCYPGARVFHLGGGTLAAQNARKTYLNFRNNLTILVKNESESPLFPTLFKRMSLDGLAAFHMLFTRGFSHFSAVLRAHGYFYLHLRKLFSKRKQSRVVPPPFNPSGYYRGSIVREFFVHRRKKFADLNSHNFQFRDKKSTASR